MVLTKAFQMLEILGEWNPLQVVTWFASYKYGRTNLPTLAFSIDAPLPILLNNLLKAHDTKLAS